MTIKVKEIDEGSVIMGDVVHTDYPDFSDAVLVAARWSDGTPLSGHEVDLINDNCPGLINRLAFESLID